MWCRGNQSDDGSCEKNILGSDCLCRLLRVVVREPARLSIGKQKGDLLPTSVLCVGTTLADKLKTNGHNVMSMLPPMIPLVTIHDGWSATGMVHTTVLAGTGRR